MVTLSEIDMKRTSLKLRNLILLATGILLLQDIYGHGEDILSSSSFVKDMNVPEFSQIVDQVQTRALKSRSASWILLMLIVYPLLFQEEGVRIL